MKIHSFAVSDIGLKRKVNQDAFLKDDTMSLYIVADGMGGHRGGEVASQLSIDVFRKYCEENPNIEGRELLSKGINAACEAIFKKAKDNDDLFGMGTTMVALLFRNESVFVGQVGDSRAYLLNENGIWQITEDHSLLNEEIRSGRLALGQVANYQFKNVITRSVGYESHVSVDVYIRNLRDQDMFLICTDGLSGLVEAKEMFDHIKEKGPEKGISQLVELANQRGGDDNITALICSVELTQDFTKS